MNKINKSFLVLAILVSALSFSGDAIAQSARTQELRQKAEIRAEQARQKIQEAREKAQENVAQKRQLLAERVKVIKDTQKRQMAEKIIKQLDRINKIWTDHFTAVLGHLDAVLQKITSRMEKAQKAGDNVAEVLAAIAKAQSAIESARGAVTVQAQKTYNASVPADSSANQEATVKNLREEFKKLRSQLFADLKALRDGAIKDARTAVRNALQALKGAPKADEQN